LAVTQIETRLITLMRKDSDDGEDAHDKAIT
jgi:hypothetical protein